MNYMRKQLAKYILYVGLPLFVLHYAGEAFEKVGTIQVSLQNISERANGG